MGTNAFERRGRILALLTALKQICNHPAQYLRDAPPAPTGCRAARASSPARPRSSASSSTPANARWCSPSSARWASCWSATSAGTLGLPEVPFLHGGVPLLRRDAMVQRFQEDEDAAPILLVSLRAGGHGAEPHPREPRPALRPLVEPGGRGPGHRPRPPHRPDPRPSPSTRWSPRGRSRNASPSCSTASARSPTPSWARARPGSPSSTTTSCASSSRCRPRTSPTRTTTSNRPPRAGPS
jgi:hypothetical protein